MVQALVRQTGTTWVDICPLSAIAPNTGVCAWVEGEQVAIFRVGNESEVFAISNYDPFSKAFVLSRGIVGESQWHLQSCLPNLQAKFQPASLDSALMMKQVSIPTYNVRVVEDRVQVAVGEVA
jgi:nitrite reductase (NADH) small subunit